MPTIVLQVGQCGNQLGAALWTQMLCQQQQQQLPKRSKDGSLSLAREFFSAGSSNAEDVLVPRVICIDSEPKVIGGEVSGCSGHRLHILGHAGCGNNCHCSTDIDICTVCAVPLLGCFGHEEQAQDDEQVAWPWVLLKGPECPVLWLWQRGREALRQHVYGTAIMQLRLFGLALHGMQLLEVVTAWCKFMLRRLVLGRW
eukprot:gene9761-9918_t